MFLFVTVFIICSDFVRCTYMTSFFPCQRRKMSNPSLVAACAGTEGLKDLSALRLKTNTDARLQSQMRRRSLNKRAIEWLALLSSLAHSLTPDAVPRRAARLIRRSWIDLASLRQTTCTQKSSASLQQQLCLWKKRPLLVRLYESSALCFCYSGLREPKDRRLQWLMHLHLFSSAVAVCSCVNLHNNVFTQEFHDWIILV